MSKKALLFTAAILLAATAVFPQTPRQGTREVSQVLFQSDVTPTGTKSGDGFELSPKKLILAKGDSGKVFLKNNTNEKIFLFSVTIFGQVFDFSTIADLSAATGLAAGEDSTQLLWVENLSAWTTDTLWVEVICRNEARQLFPKKEAIVVGVTPTAVASPATAALPRGFILEQNYPNPFNPSTTIRFSLQQAERVNLAIYNAIGQEVANLVNERLAPGTHNITWDASAHAAGMYFYKLKVAEQEFTKKMLLVK